jgi:UDP-N-acetylglucosamine transferase subunit ALG13
MIFIAVGTQKFQLNRLLKKIDDLIESEVITEEVFAQIGQSDYQPRHYRFARFLGKEEFDQMINRCSILISHSGVSTIILGMKHEKPIIVFPRLEKYGEHVDDHQMEIAKSFADLNYVLLCDNPTNLGLLIHNCREHQFERYQSDRKKMISSIRGFLCNI